MAGALYGLYGQVPLPTLMIELQDTLFEPLVAGLVALMAALGFCLQAATSRATARKGSQTPDTLRRAAVCSSISENLEGKAGGAPLNQTYNMPGGLVLLLIIRWQHYRVAVIAGARY